MPALLISRSAHVSSAPTAPTATACKAKAAKAPTSRPASSSTAPSTPPCSKTSATASKEPKPAPFFSPDQIWQVVAFVRALSSKGSAQAPPGNPTRDTTLFRASGRANYHLVQGGGGANGPELSSIGSPANDPHVITVGAMRDNGTATRTDDAMASYSSKGPTTFDRVVNPDLVAPGNRLFSTASCGKLAGLSINKSDLQRRFPRNLRNNGGDRIKPGGTNLAEQAWRLRSSPARPLSPCRSSAPPSPRMPLRPS
ncbi:MAG: S8 family serine peptidase [Acidobacteriaceae bacterium]|nr:S8 family serine peptidase [Acidobacteriaceae bacterium]